MEIKLITKNKNVPKSSGKIVDRGNIDPHKIQIHACLYIYIATFLASYWHFN
jgi:hypothetical protein